MNDNSSDECIICFNIIIYPNYQITLNCSHNLCVNCYNQIINDQRLMRKCPICRQDIEDNFNNILYVPIDNLEHQNIENTDDGIFNLSNAYIMMKNLLLLLFIVCVLILLILMLGIITKTMYG
jgi:hypothetical protein